MTSSLRRLLFVLLLLPALAQAQDSGGGAGAGGAAGGGGFGQGAATAAGSSGMGSSAAPATGAGTSAAPVQMPAIPSPVITNIPNSVITNQPMAVPLGAQPNAQTQPQTPAEPEAPVFEDINGRNQFQDFIGQSTGLVLPLFGYNLFRHAPTTFAPVESIPVTSDYVIGPGDSIVIRAWGQIDVDYTATVDRNGQINIPQVGVVTVAGLRFQDLHGFLKTAIHRNFHDFELNVTMGALRSIRVFVVGEAVRPGAYTVSSLSTLVNALFASGGPSSRGSMRRIQLKRDNQTVTEFDMYDLLVNGDKSKDVRLLPGDVIYIPPVGQLAALSGSVNTQAIYELKGTTTFEELIKLAGGFTNTAQGQKAMVDRIEDRTVRKVDEFTLDKVGLARTLQDGDVITVASITPRFDNAVRLQGNVAAAARYPWHEGMRVTDLLKDRNALITAAYWQRQNTGSLYANYNRREVNFDYATIQRLDRKGLVTHLYAFNLGKAIAGDARENEKLEPGDVVTIYSFDDELPETENDVLLQGSVIGGIPRRFPWREGMRVRDIIPSAQWLIDYYNYWLNTAVVAGKNEAIGLKTAAGVSAKNEAIGLKTAVGVLARNEIGRNSVVGVSGKNEIGLSTVAVASASSEINWHYAKIVRLQPADLTRNLIAFDLGKAVIEGNAQSNLALRPGDEITIFTKSEIPVPVDQTKVFVRLEGEFNRSGIYQALPGETLRELVKREGGFAPKAYLFGAVFTRESTRVAQQKSLDEAINRLEVDAQRSLALKAQNVSVSSTSSTDTESLSQEAAAQQSVLAHLRQLKATGRITLKHTGGAQLQDIPDLPLENGDRLQVPTRPSTVSVIGAVFNPGSFMYDDDQSVNAYLAQAGGPTRTADEGAIYVLRADGSAISKRQSWMGSFSFGRMMPGDAIVVPEDFDHTTWTKTFKDWGQILYQFGLGAAAVKILRQ